MIPLIRPIFPSTFSALLNFETSQRAGQFTNFGPLHLEVEDELNKRLAGFCLPVCNGTVALEVAIRSLGLPPGSGVMVPDFTHVGTLLAVRRAGLLPVIGRVDPQAWVLDIETVEDAWAAGRIQAVIVVNPFGYDDTVIPWEALQDRSGIGLVYDYAGAWGSFPTVSNPVCYSFHATKSFGIGEGGVVRFSSKRDLDAARRLINFGTLPDRTIGRIDGFNGKMDELHCSYLLAGLRDEHQALVAERMNRRRDALHHYLDALPNVRAPEPIYYPSLVVVQGLPAQAIEDASEYLGAVCKRYYPLISRMAIEEGGFEVFSASDDTMTTCLALPADVSDVELWAVTDSLNHWLKTNL